MGKFDRQLRAFFRGANELRHATEDAVYWFRSVHRYAIEGDTTGEGELNTFLDSLYRLRELIPVYHKSCYDSDGLIRVSLIHNINTDRLQVVLYGDRAANSAAEAVFVLAEVVAARLMPLDQWQSRRLPRLGYMPDVWAKLLPVCKRIRKSLTFLDKQEFVRLEAQLEIEETRVQKWSLANDERERKRLKQRLREKRLALRATEDRPPVETPHQKNLNTRNDQLKLLRKTHKLAGTKNEAAKLNALANDDPVIKQIGLKVTTNIVRTVIGLRGPRLRSKKS